MTDMKNRVGVQGSAAFPPRLVLYLGAGAIGCAVGPLSEWIFPLWMALKPLPSTVESALVNTPLQALSQGVIFFLLYVPDLLLLCLAGCLGGLWTRRIPWVWVSACVICYASASVFRASGPWWRFLSIVPHGLSRDGLFWGAMLVALTCAPYFGAWATSRLRPPPDHPGECKKCRYPLFGLTSGMCPECGLPYVGKDQDPVDNDSSAQAGTGQGTARSSAVLRILAVAVLLLASCSCDWIPVRTQLRDTVMVVLRQLGHHPFALIHEGSPALMIREGLYFYTRDCIHLDLVAVVVPFVWALGSHFWRNAFRVLATGCAIEIANVVRSVVAVHYDALGVDWVLSHDFPNYCIWFAAIAAAVLVVRRDVDVPPRCTLLDPARNSHLFRAAAFVGAEGQSPISTTRAGTESRKSTTSTSVGSTIITTWKRVPAR